LLHRLEINWQTSRRLHKLMYCSCRAGTKLKKERDWSPTAQGEVAMRMSGIVLCLGLLTSVAQAKNSNFADGLSGGPDYWDVTNLPAGQRPGRIRGWSS
jgi:hypothetical protein